MSLQSLVNHLTARAQQQSADELAARLRIPPLAPKPWLEWASAIGESAPTGSTMSPELRALCAAIAACMPADLVEAARAARDRARETSQALQAAQAELAELEADPADNLPLVELEARVLRRAALPMLISRLDRHARVANDAYTQAVGAARTATEYAIAPLRDEVRAQIVAHIEAAERAQRAAADLELALMNAQSQLRAWLPND